MKTLARYIVAVGLIAIALLGIPLILPIKGNPYTGKSVSEKSALQLNA